MFEPKELASDRVRKIKIYTAPVYGEKFNLQYTIAQVEYIRGNVPLDATVSFTFCLPDFVNKTVLQQVSDVPVVDVFIIEKISSRYLGCVPVRDASQIMPLRTFVCDASPEIILQTGCKSLVMAVPVPSSVSEANAARAQHATHFIMSWCHELLKTETGMPFLFIPTFNDTLTKWICEMYVPKMPGVRFGLSAKSVPGLGDVVKIMPTGNCVPCQNFFIYTNQTLEEKVRDRLYLGTSGSRTIDETSGRRVSFFEAGLQVVPVVCGCFLYDSERFGGSHIPIVVTERMSRLAPVRFLDGPSSSVLVEILTAPGVVQQYLCYPENRHEYKYVNWCEFRKITP